MDSALPHRTGLYEPRGYTLATQTPSGEEPSLRRCLACDEGTKILPLNNAAVPPSEGPSSMPAAASGHYLVEAVSVGGGKSPSMMKPSWTPSSFSPKTATKPS